MYQNGQALQRAIDEASFGDAVLLPPAIYLCGSLELRNKLGTGWLTIKAANTDVDLPPEGNRISPAQKAFMPTIISPGFNVPPVRTESGAHNYRLIGLEITKLDPAAFIQEMVVIDADQTVGEARVTDMAAFPHDIIIDRCYIHGLPSNDMKRGIRLYCMSCAVIDSYIADAHVIGQEAQAILFGGGPLKISNNYLEAAGENLFAQDCISLRSATFLMPPSQTTAMLNSVSDLNVGDGIAIWDGSTRLYTHVTSIAGNQIRYDSLSAPPSGQALVYWGRVPTDIDISYNYLFKPMSWNAKDPSYGGYHPNVKNLFELKAGRRVWVHENVLENNWADGQDGTAILLTVRNQIGDCYFCAVEDITLENNVVTNAFKGIAVLSTDYNGISGPTQTIIIKNNLFLGMTCCFQEATIDSEIIDHNTMVVGGYAVSVDKGASRHQNQFTNNIIISSWASGFHYNDGTPPDWHNVFPNWTFASNVFSRINGFSAFFYMRDYESGNFEVDSPEDIDFVDWPNENLALTSTSWARYVATDGGAIGADVAMLTSLRSEVISGAMAQKSPTIPVPPTQRATVLSPLTLKVISPAPRLNSTVAAPSLRSASLQRSRAVRGYVVDQPKPARTTGSVLKKYRNQLLSRGRESVSVYKHEAPIPSRARRQAVSASVQQAARASGGVVTQSTRLATNTSLVEAMPVRLSINSTYIPSEATPYILGLQVGSVVCTNCDESTPKAEDVDEDKR
jgi:hypothetical protein